MLLRVLSCDVVTTILVLKQLLRHALKRFVKSAGKNHLYLWANDLPNVAGPPHEEL